MFISQRGSVIFESIVNSVEFFPYYMILMRLKYAKIMFYCYFLQKIKVIYFHYLIFLALTFIPNKLIYLFICLEIYKQELCKIKSILFILFL